MLRELGRGRGRESKGKRGRIWEKAVPDSRDALGRGMGVDLDGVPESMVAPNNGDLLDKYGGLAEALEPGASCTANRWTLDFFHDSTACTNSTYK